MYVTNLEDSIDESKLYHCSGVVANYLIYTANIPLFGRAKAGGYLFAKTKKLEEAIKTLPFWMKLFSNFP